MPDPILLWNEVALEANRTSHSTNQGEQTGPPLSARALAIVHLAMYDAYAGVVGDPKNLPRYLANPSAPSSGLSPDVAIAGAAHRALTKLYPSQQAVFDLILCAAGDPNSVAHCFGAAVADAILDHREGDPGVGAANYRPRQARGGHRPDPDNIGQGFHAPDYGRLSRGFGITTRFELDRPPFDGSSSSSAEAAEYLRALRQVRGKGIKPDLMGTLPADLERRTPEETLIGLYWAYDGAVGLGTPPRLFNQIIRRLAMSRSPGNPKAPNSVAENARLFALVNVALADAGIVCWDQKYVHEFWRPTVGIREHDSSMGPSGSVAANSGGAISPDCDPDWLPLGAPKTNSPGAKNFTPHFPAYPSGHATFGAAALHMARLFYGQGGTYAQKDLTPDTLFDGLDFVSEELNGINTDNAGTVRARHRRDFRHGLWQMIDENGRSRVYLGVHWVFDAFLLGEDRQPELYRNGPNGKPIGGVPLGLLVAEDIFRHGDGKAPKPSTVGPRPQSAPAPESARAATFSSKYL